MNFRKLAVVTLSASLFVAPLTAVPVAAAEIPEEAESIVETWRHAAYASYTGVITEVREAEGIRYLSLNSETDGEATIVIAEQTFVSAAVTLQEGEAIIGLYDASRPMLMIYPPQYTVDFIFAAPSDSVEVKADYFDENLLSSDGELKLNIGEDTEILTAELEPFEGDLAKHRLMVTYSFTTRSIPAQTTPLKVIVLGLGHLAPLTSPPSYEETPAWLAPTARAYYGSYSGVIADIDADSSWVTVEHEDGGEAVFVIDEDTILYEDLQLEVGLAITGYFEADRPLTLQYPPRYNAVLLMKAPEDQSSVKVDLFDVDLVSRDGQLKLNIAEQTEIVDAAGNPFEGALGGKKLVVFYTITTRSIPAQTTPHKIVVLDPDTPEVEIDANTEDESEKLQPPAETSEIAELPEEPEDLYTAEEVAQFSIVVEDEILAAAPAPYMNDKGVIMVPVRAIAEALGYKVSWNASAQTVGIGSEISFVLNADLYLNKDVSYAMDTAAVIRDNATYVPLKFFNVIVGLNNAYVFEGQIVINDGEAMQ